MPHADPLILQELQLFSNQLFCPLDQSCTHRHLCARHTDVCKVRRRGEPSYPAVNIPSHYYRYTYPNVSNNNQVIITMLVYSVGSAISNFFASHTTATQQECNERAISVIGAQVTPVPIQGVFSYTVVGGSPARLVQFRTPDSDLNMDFLHLARSIHGSVVASSTYHGCIGHSQPLSVYVIEKLPGVTYMESCIMNGANAKPSPEMFQRRRNTIMDFARYCRSCVASRGMR